ncbi:MAG: class I SAM-dependent methyltransferase, partial [Cyanobacteria bacterium J06648_11]
MQCSNCNHVPLSRAGEGDRPLVFCANCGQTYRVLDSGAIDFLTDETFFKQLTPAQIVAHNDLFAWSYERLWRGNALSILTGSSFSTQRESDLLNSWLEDADPILDLAAAAGYWSRMILQQRPDVTLVGLDNSAPLLAEAARQRRSRWSN